MNANTLKHNVRVIEDEDYIFLEFDGRAIQGKMNKKHPDFLVLAYLHVMNWGLLLAEKIDHIGVVGLGGGAIPKWLINRTKCRLVSVAEIDDRVIALAERFRIPTSDARLHIKSEAGEQFVKTRRNQFDVLYVDGFDGDGVPAALKSDAFYNDVKHALKSEGVAIVNIGTDLDALAVLKTVFDQQLYVVKSPFNAQMVVYALPTNRLLDRAVLAERALFLEQTTRDQFYQGIKMFCPLYGFTPDKLTVEFLGKEWPFWRV